MLFAQYPAHPMYGAGVNPDDMVLYALTTLIIVIIFLLILAFTRIYAMLVILHDTLKDFRTVLDAVKIISSRIVSRLYKVPIFRILYDSLEGGEDI